MLGTCSDVVCVKDGHHLRSTDFYVRFSFTSLRSGALAILGLNQSADWEASSSAFVNKPSCKVPHDHTVHEANRLGAVEVYSNGELCPGVHVSVQQSNHGLLHFLENDKKTVRPSSATLSHLNLQLGENIVEFRMLPPAAGSGRLGSAVEHEGRDGLGGSAIGEATPWLAVATTCVHVYSPRDRLVVFDIDGTITKADVRGYLETVILDRYDFVHDQVSEFAQVLAAASSSIKFIYITSRPLEHLRHTRKLLSECRGGPLPPGPVLMNRENMATALVQEAVMRRSAGMKTKYLEDIRLCFKGETHPSPFVLGFGNRASDNEAYRRGALLPEDAIYIVDTSSVLRSTGGAVFQGGFSCPKLRSRLEALLQDSAAK